MKVKHCPDCGHEEKNLEVKSCFQCKRTLLPGPRPENFKPVIAERPPYSER